MNLITELKRRNVIRVGIAYVLVAWVLLQAADFGLDLIDAPNWVIQTLFLLAALGLPVVVVFSWVYEMTPEGLRLEKDVDRGESITPSTGRKLDRIIIAFLAVTVAFLIAGQYYGIAPSAPKTDAADAGQAAEPPPDEVQEPAAEALPSIAVLPFVNMSSDPEQDYFADGIAEEILNSLARVSGLKVAGRTSSFAFKDKQQDLREIGEALGVAHILEGSVRKQGDQVRITAQLVQVADGFHLWSDTYDRTLEDIFAIQDEIATAILRQAQIQLLEGESIAATRVNPAAYQNYVAAKQRIHERTQGGMETAVNLLRDATQMDPGFAGAWAELGVATMLLSDGLGSYGDIPEEEAQARGREYLERALAIDPNNAEALAGMGLYWQNQPPVSRTNVAKGVNYLERALAQNPGLIDASHWLGRALQFLGEDSRSQKIWESMVERDPFYWPAVSNLVVMYARKNRLAEAHDLNDRTMRYRPELPFRQKAPLLNFEGRYAEALPLALEVWAIRPDPLTFLPLGDALRGTHQFERLLAIDNAPDRGHKALALAYLGRVEEGKMVGQSSWRDRGDPGDLISVLAIAGQYRELVEFLEATWPDLETFDREFQAFGGYGYPDMLHIALAYQQTGDQASFRQAMELTRAEHDRQDEVGFDTYYLDLAEASYWTLADNESTALDFLQSAVARGMSVAPRLARAVPQLKTLEGVPRYEEIQAQSLTHLNEQRAALELPPLEAAY